MGVNVNRVIALVFVIGPAIGAVGGLFIGLCQHGKGIVQRRHVGHRIVVDVEHMRIDQAHELLNRQLVRVDSTQQFRSNRIG